MKYDKTLREIFNSTPVVLIKLLIGKEIKENLNPKFPSIEEREVDFLVRLENDEIFHLEIQSVNDKNMPIRMLRYAILIENRYKKFPIQAVLYVGDKRLNIKNEIKFNNLSYSYKVYDIKEIDCNKLINSSSIEDNVLSILCKIDNEDRLIDKIIRKLSKIEEKRRKDYIEKLLILARLRPKVYNKLKSNIEESNMPIVFDPQTDPVYKEGMEYGLQLGLQRGLEQGMQQGLEQGIQRGLQQGLEQGIQRGLQQGIKKAKLEDAKALIKQLHLSIEDVAKILNIPLEELKKYLYQRY